jgi:glutaredoxin 3
MVVYPFSKSFCPYCTKTKALFTELGVNAKIYELNEMDDGAAIQDALFVMTGQRTVPNVFINQKHIGGNDSVQAANKTGKLKELLGI